MAQGNPAVLSPPIAPTVEIESVTFDFGALLASNYSAGTYIQSVVEINVTVQGGEDPTPQSRLIAGPNIVASQREPALPDGAVTAWFGNMIAGCLYLLQCVVLLSDGTSQPSIEVRLPCYDPSA